MKQLTKKDVEDTVHESLSRIAIAISGVFTAGFALWVLCYIASDSAKWSVRQCVMQQYSSTTPFDSTATGLYRKIATNCF